jgi:hypothetical protein
MPFGTGRVHVQLSIFSDAESKWRAAADKISKVRELRLRLASGSNPKDIESALSRHRASLVMLEDTIPGTRLVDLLRFEVEALEELPPRAEA